MKKVRVGHINFLNVLPLTYGLKKIGADDIEIVSDVPSALNEKIKNGFLDISAISAAAYAGQHDKLLILPGICIRADCDVTSIILISRKPIEEIKNDKIILTSKSATSHRLLKIILSEGYGASPEYEIRQVFPENPVDNDATGALLIGDDALYDYLHTPESFYCYDLGKEWHKLTGRSMVYAVWAVRKDFAAAEPELLKKAHEIILNGFKFGIENKNAAINSIINEKPFTFEELDNYLGNIIKWNLTADGLENLKNFYKLAGKLKLSDDVPKIEIAKI